MSSTYTNLVRVVGCWSNSNEAIVAFDFCHDWYFERSFCHVSAGITDQC